MIRLLILIFILSGCATTESGKVMYKHAAVDLGSTAIALSASDTASEGNPLGYGVIGVKLALPLIADRLECRNRVLLAKSSGIMTAFAATNNISVAVGGDTETSIGIGLLSALLFSQVQKEPEFCN